MCLKSFTSCLQVIRKLEVWPLGVVLEESFRVFVDSRDQGPLILTHLYLLTGCTVPLWLGAPSTNMESTYTCVPHPHPHPHVPPDRLYRPAVAWRAQHQHGEYVHVCTSPSPSPSPTSTSWQAALYRCGSARPAPTWRVRTRISLTLTLTHTYPCTVRPVYTRGFAHVLCSLVFFWKEIATRVEQFSGKTTRDDYKNCKCKQGDWPIYLSFSRCQNHM